MTRSPIVSVRLRAMVQSLVASSATLMLLLLVMVAIAAPPASALRFAIIGDWGMGGRSAPWQTEIRSAGALNEACVSFGCNFTLSCGDNIYTGDVNLGLRESFRLFENPTGPFFPVSGNHDSVGAQLAYARVNKRWKWPSSYYDFVVPIDDAGESGHTVHFFALDATDGGLAGGGQYAWLEAKLKASTSRWKIMFGHYPFAGSGRHRREGPVTQLAGLMDKYNVQVYFAGHDHLTEVNNMQGRTLPISGAMSRGGMMLRGIAGAFHVFTLTNPGEFNKDTQDWPGHGFLTAELSPNVLTMHVWDHYGGVLYSFAVTHDWIAKVKTMPKSLENKWPPADVVRDAMMAERTLSRGPGGGTFYSLDGDERPDAPATTTTLAAGATAAPTTATTTAPPQMAALTTQMPKELRDAARTRDILSRYVSYTVSSECDNCDRQVYANETFSVFIIGVDLKGSSRVFLS